MKGPITSPPVHGGLVQKITVYWLAFRNTPKARAPGSPSGPLEHRASSTATGLPGGGSLKRKLGRGSGQPGGLAAWLAGRLAAGKAAVWSGGRRRDWPGGGRGGSPLGGVGRARLEGPQRMGRPARITRATPRAVVAARSWWAQVLRRGRPLVGKLEVVGAGMRAGQQVTTSVAISVPSSVV